MEKSGRFWPSEIDRQNRTTRLHVAVSQPPEEPYRNDTGIVSYTLVESEEVINARLERDFPLFRFAQWGKRIIGLTGGVNEV